MFEYTQQARPRYATTGMAIRPEPGDMYIFPAYLKHWVYPYKSDCVRVSVSGNVIDGVYSPVLPLKGIESPMGLFVLGSRKTLKRSNVNDGTLPARSGNVTSSKVIVTVLPFDEHILLPPE